ncbi:polymer-forming cytoskeletal protein [bacterium]|nr:polymer-forming cytoskeletal protein [bacterium]
MKKIFIIVFLFLSIIIFGQIHTGSYVLEKNSIAKKNLIIFGSGRIDGLCLGNLTFYGDELEINGTIKGDLNFIGKKLLLNSTSHIEGNVHFIGEGMILEEGSQIDGKYYNKYVLKNIRYFPFTSRKPIYIPFIFILKFIIAFLVFLLFPNFIKSISQYVSSHPISSYLWGVLSLFLVFLLIIILLITIIGIPFALLVMLLLLFTILFASTTFAYYIGHLIIKSKDRLLEYIAFFIGFTIAYLLNLHPLIHTIYIIFILVGFLGAVFVKLFK